MGGLFSCLKKSKHREGRGAATMGRRSGRHNNHPLHHRNEEERMAAKMQTLEEWIFNSPSRKHGCANVRDIQVFRSQVSKVSPMLSSPPPVNIQTPHSTKSKRMKNPRSHASQPINAHLNAHLCLSSSPSTLRIQAYFAKMDRRGKVTRLSHLSRGSAPYILEQKKNGEKSDGREVMALGFGKEPCNSSESSLIPLDLNSQDDVFSCSTNSSFSTRIGPSGSSLKSRIWVDQSSSTRKSDEVSQSESPRILPLAAGVGGRREGTWMSPLVKSCSERVESRREGLVSCMRKSKSENLAKRVRFRLPQESDICIYDVAEDEESDKAEDEESDS